MVDPARADLVIAERGPDFLLGLDTSRQWATGIQAFPGPEFTLFVFREQSLMPQPDGTFHLSLKNITSIVVPTPIVKEFSTNLGKAFVQLEANEEAEKDGVP